MRIVMAASEANPFCKSGGLADVILPLSKEYVKAGHKVTVMIPFYKSIKDKNLARYDRIGEHLVTMNWRYQYAKYFTFNYHGIEYIFVGNPYYFDRDNLYGYGDDGERFAFFSLACLEYLDKCGEQIDIIHVHDHQTAFIPTLLKEKRGYYPNLLDTKTVLTIHNPAFKGMLEPSALPELFELPISLYENGAVRFGNGVSTLKAGILYADKVTTVSPNHAKELLTPELSMGLSGVLELRKEDFSGIVNGIDEEEWDPSNDPFLSKTFNRDTFAEGKKASRAKMAFYRDLKNPVGPCFGLVSRLTEQKGGDLIIAGLEYILSRGHLAFVCGSGDGEIEWRLHDLKARYPQTFGLYIGYNNQFAHDIYGGCDFFLMPSRFEPCGIGQLLAKRYGTLPIARATGGLVDTICPWTGRNYAHADGLLFKDFTSQAFIAAIKSAESLYSKPKMMEHLVQNAMDCDHSWAHSGASYLALYQQILD